MSEKTVRTYRNVSNRLKTKDPSDHKTVFKSSLDNPFQISWPRVSVNLQNALLARVVILLDGMAQYQSLRRKEKKKRTKTSTGALAGSEADPASAVAQMEVEIPGQSDDAIPSSTEDPEADGPVSSAPFVRQYLTIGINAVTKKLESLSQLQRTQLSNDGTDTSHSDPLVNSQLVLVCQGDIDPPILISHLPSLVAACNSRRPSTSSKPSDPISWLVPLARGAEETLTSALGLRRVSVLAIDTTLPFFRDILPLLEPVPIVSASWLAPSPEAPLHTFVQTHIKQIRTTAPKNMKAAKEKRIRDRLAAKARKKASMPNPLPNARKQRITAGGVHQNALGHVAV
ncbi:hypothetical protein EIP91_000560 [Steccherinum ochraceum]|uniref:Uncharacterized protein n=1 Tax=Steccherinum ochraceum TaxID=92696 RepID=A0A4V2MWQ7_9APHY|nr:hypothetical protein EIP91_000560 [Steccherinum ochraceum]